MKVDYTPHPAQYEIHRARKDYRFRTVAEIEAAIGACGLAGK